MAEHLGRTDSSAAMLSLFSAYADEKDAESPEPEEQGVDAISDDDSDTADVPSRKVLYKRLHHSDSDHGERPPAKQTKKATRLVSYGPDDADEELEREEDEDAEDVRILEIRERRPGKVVSSLSTEMAASLSQSVRNLSAEEIKIPPEPLGKCSNKLQETIVRLYEKTQRGFDLSASIQRRKDFRNPSIYEKLIQFCDIDEKGTNYPPELYDPSLWGPESFYDELAKSQKAEMDKREKEKKDRTKIEFVMGTKKPGEMELKRKTKWDTQPPAIIGAVKPAIIAAAALNPPVVSVASGTKTTVISAVGTIKKTK